MPNIRFNAASPSLDCPRLAVTLGDPAGVGPEVVLKALSDPNLSGDCELVVVGSQKILAETYTRLHQQFRTVLHAGGGPSLLADPDKLSIIDLDLDCHAGITLGVGNAASGAASFSYLNQAIDQTLAGEFQGIVTGPIAKSAWKAAGHHYAGQTELLAERAGTKQYGMLFVARSPYTGWTLRTLLATAHIPLRQVADALTPELLSAKLDLLLQCLKQDFGLDSPGKIAIAGLNPHSGEQGQLGSEEKDWLIPWLEQARSRWPQTHLEGPVPPDTLWIKPAQAWYGAAYTPKPREAIQAHDAYLALYHDQGLIPVKLLAFDRAVNTTIGLPFVRTSPDHGTAFDIAGQGIADATSMTSAIQLAANLARQRLSFT